MLTKKTIWEEDVGKLGKRSVSSLFITVLKTFSSKSVSVSDVSLPKEWEYYRSQFQTQNGLLLETENFLKGNLLWNTMFSEPKKIIDTFLGFCKITGNPDILLAIADFCCFYARNTDISQSFPFYLTAHYFSNQFIVLKQAEKEKNEELPVNFSLYKDLRIKNESLAGIFRFLKKNVGFNYDKFSAYGADGRHFTLRKPEFHLSVPPEVISDFSQCSEKTIHGFQVVNRSVGIGVPLVATISEKKLSRSLKTPAGLTIPVTMLAPVVSENGNNTELQPLFWDTNLDEVFHHSEKKLFGENWTLAQDFTTPLACFLSNLEKRNLLSAMLNPLEQKRASGLFMIEPYQPTKIPVVFVHGLLSSPETWGQMLNCIKFNAAIRKNYQFWFFSYSTGLPLISSVRKLRQKLLEAQKEYCTTPEATAQFNKMVIIGHSMGGLVTRLLLQQDPDFMLTQLSRLTIKEIRERLSEKDFQLVEKYFSQTAPSFISRTILMAVPHRGSKLAQNAIAKLGIKLTKLPKSLTSLANECKRISKILRPDFKGFLNDRLLTGINNLNPNAEFVKVLGNSPLCKRVIYHSIIGNKNQENVPGGSDGIVPYESSHIEGAASELIVKSGHSVQQSPAAIREVMRILLLHLNDTKQ